MSRTHQFVIAAVLPDTPSSTQYWTGTAWGNRTEAQRWNYPARAYSHVRTIPPVPGREIIVKAA